ncbi:MAG: Crp/Fnr family transcriptional regulator [Alphaproteobacteria bacterium]|nr:Crp/Fnr family transcriptional regulator [Alphaproteobacteria bacterium]
MSLQEEVEALGRVPLFERLDVAKLKILAFTSDRTTYAAGDYLCREGDAGDKAFVILDGKAQVWVNTNEGALHVSNMGKHDVVGEISLLSDFPRTASVLAETDLEVLILNEDVFLHMIQEFPSVGLELLRALAAKLHVTTQRLQEVANGQVAAVGNIETNSKH